MKPTIFIFFAAALVSLASQSAGAQRGVATPEQPVTRTLKIGVPGKVKDVIWSVQSDVCAVQINLLPSVRDGQNPPDFARTQVWLLKSDGTIITQTQKPTTLAISSGGWGDFFTIHAFDRSARTQAIAMVVSIDEQLFVEALTP